MEFQIPRGYTCMCMTDEADSGIVHHLTFPFNFLLGHEMTISARDCICSGK